MCIGKYDVIEIAEIIGYEFKDDSDIQNYEEIEVYHVAIDYGFTECDHCGKYVSYDDYCGTHSMCDDCLDAQ